MPNSWNAFIRDCRDRYGVATLEHARRWGIAAATFYRRTDREGWRQPFPGVRTAPWVTPSPYTDLSALLHAAGGHAAATGSTAAWLHGLRAVPTRLEVAIPHGLRVTDLANDIAPTRVTDPASATAPTHRRRTR
jgi:hypothetical protein